MIFFFLVLLNAWLHLAAGGDNPYLKNVTHNIFGDEVAILPLAFGDFNSDKLTDLIVLDQADRSKLSVLLARSQTFSLGPDKYFDPPTEAKKNGLLCYLNGRDVISAAPGQSS